MSFTDAQIRALQRNVPSRNLRSRTRDGKELTYVEGWYAIHVANRIFGFDGWDRETVETRCVVAREARGSYSVVYAAKVRISVRIGERAVVRDGHGTGESRGGSPGEAHDFALKAAETDATKRALATFGNAFGLSLYSNGKAKACANHSVKAPDSNPYPSTNGWDKHAGGHPDSKNSGASGDTGSPALSDAGPTEQSEPVASTSRPLSGSQAHGRVDKSVLSLAEPHRIRDKAHLRYVTAQPCLLCSNRPSDAHHLRFAQPRALGMKVSDQFTVPLCRAHHRQLHQSGNESSWWHDLGIDAIVVAEQLWRETEANQKDTSV